MSSLAADALALRIVDYSETSQVVTFFTREAGRLTGIAKGAKRPRSAFGGPFELFGRYRLVYRDKPSGQLLLLTAADLTDLHAGLRADPRRLTAASACAEVVLGVTHDALPVVPLFDLLAETLAALAGDWEGVLYRFLAQALTHLGHRPRLAACAVCGRGWRGTTDPLFSPRAGGAVCAGCAAAEPAPLRVRTESLARLDALCEPGAPPVPGPLPSPLRQELRGVLRSAWTHLLERPPVALGMLPP